MAEINISVSKEKFLPIYYHLLDETKKFDIEFLYGGRDSGKSRHIAMQLIYECLHENYFRCLIIRKILDTVRGSQFQMLCDVIELWGLSDLFRINTSALEIVCKINGNGFYGKGLDKVGKIKSFTNPSHVWCEEGNQITSEDFVVILTSMRSDYGRTKIYFSFNPECEMSYTEFWLWVEYFSHTEDLSFEWIRIIDTPKGPVELKIRATHVTYNDNPYVDDLRMAIHESYKTSKTNAYYYQTFTLGLWGYKRPGGVFWKGFEETKHSIDLKAIPEIANKKWTLHIGVDNNVSPYIGVQVWLIDLRGKALLQIDEIICKHPDNTATKAAMKVVEYLVRLNYNDVVYLYGDPSANARSTTDDEGRSFFDKFIGVIKSAGYDYVNRVGKSAPSVSQSASFINNIYEINYLDWKIFIDKNNRKSIEDYNMVVEAADGTMQKKRITDKQSGVSYEKYGHMSDIKRYIITSLLKDEYQQFLQRRRGVPMPGGIVSAQKVKPKLG